MPLRAAAEKDFFGRKEDLSNLYLRALESEKGSAQSIFLSGNKGVGKTELLKQLFNYLFWKQDKVAPFYYAVNSALLSVPEFSRDYLKRYLCQRLAFEKKESSFIHVEGVSIDGLAGILEERKVFWALEIIDRYIQCSDPLESLRLALNAPYQSVLSTGISVVVMTDEFQRLNNLYVSSDAAAELINLFEAPLSFGKAPHLITGTRTEIQEMPIVGRLAKVTLQPLRIEDAAQMFSSELEKYGIKTETAPYALLNHLGGNPFYVKCVAKEAGINKKSSERECWKAYINDLMGGNIYSYWSKVFKRFFPELEMRRNALEIINKIYHSGETLTHNRISRILRMLSPGREQSEAIARALYLSGFVRGEFGVFRMPEDRVLIDFVDCLYSREILGKSGKEVESEMLNRASGTKVREISYEMTIPMVKDAELVAAQCIEQIGKNLKLNPEVTGQLQMGIIEACINAMEHSKGEDRNIYLSLVFFEDRIEIGIESSGREFVSRDTGEPFVERFLNVDEAGRGWGIKLMKRFADSVRFEKTERGTKVILVKNLFRTNIDNTEKNSQ